MLTAVVTLGLVGLCLFSIARLVLNVAEGIGLAFAKPSAAFIGGMFGWGAPDYDKVDEYIKKEQRKLDLASLFYLALAPTALIAAVLNLALGWTSVA